MVKVNIRRYEAPVTHRVLVELESSFCGSIVVQNEAEVSDIGIDSQDVKTNFTYDFEIKQGETKPTWDQIQ